MKVTKTWKQLVLWAAVVSFCIPTPAVLGAEPSRVPAVPIRQADAAIADVAMGPGGVLVGHVVDAQGRIAVGVPVSIRRNGAEVVQTITDKNGGYVIHGLRGGVYEVIAGQGMRVCRLWAAKTAPPTAKPGLLVVSDPNAVLGQWEQGTFGAFLQEAKYTLTNPLVVGGIIAASVAIPVAIHNANDGS